MVEFDVVIAEFLNLKKKYGISCWLSLFHAAGRTPCIDSLLSPIALALRIRHYPAACRRPPIFSRPAAVEMFTLACFDPPPPPGIRW
jgi:hypothetical protein